VRRDVQRLFQFDRRRPAARAVPGGLGLAGIGVGRPTRSLGELTEAVMRKFRAQSWWIFTILSTIPVLVYAAGSSFTPGTVISASAVNARFAALEKGPFVNSVGYVNCQRLDALAKPGANNVLLHADTLYSDPGCANSVIGVSCHPFCAAHEIAFPEGFNTGICCGGVTAYYTKGLVQIASFGP
jgi:hypothetical protein